MSTEKLDGPRVGSLDALEAQAMRGSIDREQFVAAATELGEVSAAAAAGMAMPTHT